jgi:hypothetical protein
MIVGVLVEPELAPAVASMIVEAVRRDASRDSPALRRLLADLSEVSARTSVASVPSTSDGGPWLDTREAAKRLGVDPRTVRRRAQAKSIVGVREDGRWRIKL